MNDLKRFAAYEHGFGMIEVLISLLIFMLGIVGVSSMQGQSIQATNDSLQRSQAVWMAHEMMERMKVNPAGLESGRYQSTSAAASANVNSYCAGGAPKRCIGSSCSVDEMAEYDVHDLMCQNGEIILKALTVTCTGVANCGAGADVEVNVRWESLGARQRLSGSSVEQALSLTMRR